MSLYDGLGVETAPVIELSQQVVQANDSAANPTSLSMLIFIRMVLNVLHTLYKH